MKTIITGLTLPIASGLLGLFLTLSLSHAAQAQRISSFTQPADPHEMIIRENPALLLLRQRMEAAEREVYETFNRYNDEQRFMVSCGHQQLSGTRFNTQVCQPRFVLSAQRDYARDQFESYREFLNTNFHIGRSNYEPYMPPLSAVHPAAAVAGQTRAYQSKLREVAEQHPEFLEALSNFSERKSHFERELHNAG